MKIGIVPNLTREKALDVTKNTINYLNELKIEYFFESQLKNDLPLDVDKSLFIDNLYENVDIVVAIGGDGSFIHVAKSAAVHKKPVLCINAGNLAFLAGLEGNELHLIEKLITGDFTKDRRLLLEISLENNNSNQFVGYCVNDVVVARGSEIKLVDLDVLCNGRKINNYRADGVIVSTPTGSTAYSWSAGGPVIDPELKCIMLTPICTHSPLNRSLVFNDNDVITINSARESQELSISTDGEKSILINDNSKIVISKSNYYAEFIRIKSDEFYDILNCKLTQRRI